LRPVGLATQDWPNVEDQLFALPGRTVMECVKSHSDYGAVIYATFLWAGVSAVVATVISLFLLMLGLDALFALPWTWDSTGSIASGLFCLALGGLLLYGVTRCTVLSVARVCRSPGYPERHWWFVRRSFRSMFCTELILLGTVVGTTVVAVRGPGWLADRAQLAVGVSGAVFVCFQLVMVASLNDVLRHAAVVPYFKKRVGDIATFCSGESLARHVDELDEIARAHAVVPLSAFGWNDDLEDEPVVWHAPADGLKTVNVLLIALEQEETGWDDHAATIADLKQIAHALERADAQGIPFSFLLRHTTYANGQEWDARQGTCG
jgi:hypothetical protein